MRRTKNIELKATVAVAAILLMSGCGGPADDGWTASKDTAVCVDGNGKRVADLECDDGRAGSGAHAGGFYPYSWYYMGRGSAIPAYGEVANGGSFTRTSGATYFHAPVSTAVSSEEASVSRGGLGESAHGFSEGGHAGGFGE